MHTHVHRANTQQRTAGVHCHLGVIYGASRAQKLSVSHEKLFSSHSVYALCNHQTEKDKFLELNDCNHCKHANATQYTRLPVLGMF